MKWGMGDFERTEAFRAEFQEDEKLFLAGTETLYFDPRKRTRVSE